MDCQQSGAGGLAAAKSKLLSKVRGSVPARSAKMFVVIAIQLWARLLGGAAYVKSRLKNSVTLVCHPVYSPRVSEAPNLRRRAIQGGGFRLTTMSP